MSARPPGAGRAACRSEQRIVLGRAEEVTGALEPGSVQLVVTSPPYWSLKEYGGPGELGAPQSYPRYLRGLERVFRASVRALEGGCRLAINVGDQFARGTEGARYAVIPIHADLIRMGRRLRLEFFGNIIWRKISTTRTSGGGVWMGSVYYPRDGYVTFEHEYILLFRKPGAFRPPAPALRERSRLTKEERSLWFRGLWEVRPERQKGHAAMFPVELPERLIRMYSFVGDTVLDPFLGSGTTAAAASRAGRNSVGVESQAAFLPVMAERLGLTMDLFSRLERAEGDRLEIRSGEDVFVFEDRLGLGGAAELRRRLAARPRAVRSRAAPARKRSARGEGQVELPLEGRGSGA